MDETTKLSDAEIGQYGELAMLEAARMGQLEIIRFLDMAGGISVECTDTNGNTPLHLAADMMSDNIIEVVTYFISVSKNFNAQNNKGNTALYYALCNYANHPNLALNIMAIWHQSDDDKQKASAQKALLNTIHSGSRLFETQINFLRQPPINVDINGQNEEGQTLLHLAVKNKLVGLVEILLNAGADSQLLLNNKGELPIALLPQDNHPNTQEIRMLLQEKQLAAAEEEGPPGGPRFPIGKKNAQGQKNNEVPAYEDTPPAHAAPPTHCSTLVIPFKDDTGKGITAKNQAIQILNEARRLHNQGRGAQEVGITYSANLQQTKDIKTHYTSGRKIPLNINGSNQAVVMHEMLGLLKSKEYQDLTDVMKIVPITTMRPGNSATDKEIQESLDDAKAFAEKPSAHLILWQNQSTAKKGCIAAIGDGIAMQRGYLSPKQFDLIQTQLRAIHSQNAVAVAPKLAEGVSDDASEDEKADAPPANEPDMAIIEDFFNKVAAKKIESIFNSNPKVNRMFYFFASQQEAEQYKREIIALIPEMDGGIRISNTLGGKPSKANFSLYANQFAQIQIAALRNKAAKASLEEIKQLSSEITRLSLQRSRYDDLIQLDPLAEKFKKELDKIKPDLFIPSSVFTAKKEEGFLARFGFGSKDKKPPTHSAVPADVAPQQRQNVNVRQSVAALDEKEDAPRHQPENLPKAHTQQARDFVTIKDFVGKHNNGEIVGDIHDNDDTTFVFRSADEAYQYAGVIERWLLDSDPSIGKLKVELRDPRDPKAYFTLTAPQVAALNTDVNNATNSSADNQATLSVLKEQIREHIVEPMNKNGALSNDLAEAAYRTQILGAARRLYKIMEIQNGRPLEAEKPKGFFAKNYLITVKFAEDMQVFYDPIACKYTAGPGLKELADQLGKREAALLQAIGEGKFAKDPQGKESPAEADERANKAIHEYNRPYQRSATARAVLMSIELGLLPQTVLYDAQNQQPSPLLQDPLGAAQQQGPHAVNHEESKHDSPRPSRRSHLPQRQAQGNAEQLASVEESDMFARAQQLHRDNLNAVITLLNAANDYTAGGGATTGEVAQEEMFDRCTNLLLAIVNDSLNYVLFSGGNLYNDRGRIRHLPHFENHIASITRGITFFALPEIPPNAHWKSSIYKILDVRDRFQANVLSNASINLGHRNPGTQTLKAKYQIKARLAAQFYALEQERQKQPGWQENRTKEFFVTTAFGCGAFRNDPELVAKWYAEAIAVGNYQCAFAIQFLVIGNNYRHFKARFLDKAAGLLAGDVDEVKEDAPLKLAEDPQPRLRETDADHAKRCTDAMSDHESQISQDVVPEKRVGSQNLQSPYAIIWEGPIYDYHDKERQKPKSIVKPGRWKFDVPYGTRFEGAAPSKETLMRLTGMFEDDCKAFREAVLKDTDSVYKGDLYDAGQNGECVRAHFQQWKTEKKYKGVIGEKLGQGGFRLCLETNEHYEARIRKQLQHLINAAGGRPQVLSLQETPYNFDGDLQRQKIFQNILEELGYIEMTFLEGRDVGIAVRMEDAHKFQPINNPSNLYDMLVQDDMDTRNFVSLRGCAIEGDGKLCINIHADRVKVKRDKNNRPTESNEQAMDRYIQQLIQLIKTAVAHAVQQGNLTVHINGDFNLFALTDDQQQTLKDAGFGVKPVMGQEKFPTPTCEAWIDGSTAPALRARQEQEHAAAAPQRAGGKFAAAEPNHGAFFQQANALERRGMERSAPPQQHGRSVR